MACHGSSSSRFTMPAVLLVQFLKRFGRVTVVRHADSTRRFSGSYHRRAILYVCSKTNASIINPI
jgi:hypothetical protein